MSYKLAKNEIIVTAYADRHAGPGWSNTPVWVFVHQPDGKFRRDCIQPEDMTPAIWRLFDVSYAAHKAMVSAVQELVDKRSRRNLRGSNG